MEEENRQGVGEFTTIITAAQQRLEAHLATRQDSVMLCSRQTLRDIMAWGMDTPRFVETVRAMVSQHL